MITNYDHKSGTCQATTKPWWSYQALSDTLSILCNLICEKIWPGIWTEMLVAISLYVITVHPYVPRIVWHTSWCSTPACIYHNVYHIIDYAKLPNCLSIKAILTSPIQATCFIFFPCFTCLLPMSSTCFCKCFVFNQSLLTACYICSSIV